MAQSMTTSCLLALSVSATESYTMSKLAPIGWLLKHQDAEWSDAMLVSATTEHGLVGLCVDYISLHGSWFILPLSVTPSIDEGTCYSHRRWRLLHLSVPEGWYCYHIKPALCPTLGPSPLPPDRVRLELNLHPWTLVAASAMTSWHGVTVAELQACARHMQWKDVGRTEAELVRNMTRYALPELPANGPELRWLVSQRLGDHIASRKVVTALTPEAEQELRDAIPAEELDDMLGASRTRKRSSQRSAQQPSTSEVPGTAIHAAPQQQSVPTNAASASSSTTPAPEKTRMIDPRPRDGAAFTLEDARDLMPRAPGCGIAIHSGKAWQVKYTGRTSAGPKSRMGTYGGRDSLSFNTALKVCLQWVWDRHIEAHPTETCPINWAAFPL
eukprot:1275929-Amphidinium_carterae.1